MSKTKVTSAAGKPDGAKSGPVGRLLDKSPGDALDINIYDPKVKLEDLFGDLGGAALLERILLWYQESELECLPWYSEDDGQAKTRNIVKSPLSRDLQESTISRYMQRIFSEGLSQVVSGSALMRWRASDKAYPVMALGFNHRAESFYRCDLEDPTNSNVSDSRARGLRNVRVLHWNTPDSVVLKAVSLLNQYHEGSAENHWDILAEALRLEAAWKAQCCVSKLNTYNPRYQSAYENFVLQTSTTSEYSGFFKNKQTFYNAIALAHHLQQLGVYKLLASWSNAFVDFLDPRYNPHVCISQMHCLTVMITNSQKKLCSKEKLGGIVMEALKACVPSCSKSLAKAGGRTLSFVFIKGGAETSRLMNLMNLPMDNSAVTRKMQKDSNGAGRGAGSAGMAKQPDVALTVKKELSQVQSLNIQLKPGELKKLRSSGIDMADVDMKAKDDTGNGASSESAADGSSPPQNPDRPENLEEGEAPSKRQKTAKGKVQQKRCQFKPYDDEEKKSFSTTITVPGMDSRVMTALDDIIQALNFVLSKLVKAKVFAETELESDRVLSTYSFCVGLFLEFAWNGKVSVNGKDFRQYSALRGELQQLLITTNEELFCSLESSPDGTDPANGSKGSKAMNPLELAEVLMQNLLNKPVTSVIWDVDDPDEQVIKNIVDAMTIKRLDEPIKKFVAEKLHLPVLMHQSVQEALQQIFAVEPPLQLLDVMSIIYTAISTHLPPSWCGFAFDVATSYADRGHFVENTDEVFGTVANVQEFAGLRTKYLLVILKEVLENKPISEVTDERKIQMIDIVQLGVKSEDFQTLVVFDSVQFAASWAREWTSLLLSATSLDDMVGRIKALKTVSVTQQKARAGKAASEDGGSMQNAPGDEARSTPAPEEQNQGGEGSSGKGEQPAGKSSATTSSAPSVGMEMSVNAINQFRDGDLLRSLQLLDHSKEATELKLSADMMKQSPLSALFMKVVERKLEVLQWQMFHVLQKGDSNVVLNMSGSKKDQLRVNLPLQGSMCLPFAGTLSLQQNASGGGSAGAASKGSSYFFATIFGMHFYVHGKRADVHTMDLVVPSWAAKPVSKSSERFFKQVPSSCDFLVVLQADQGPLDISFHLCTPDNEEDLKMMKEQCEVSGGGACWCVARLQTLVPVANFEEKLNKDFESQKDKAEKAAKNLVQAANRKNQIRDLKETKKRKKGQAEAKDEAEQLQAEIDANQAGLQKLQLQEAEEEQVQAAIECAVAKCKPRTSIPLTVMVQQEAVEKSARVKAMMDAVQKAEEQLQKLHASGDGGEGDGSAVKAANPQAKGESSSQETAVGIQGALHLLRRQGSLAQKPVKGKTNKKDDKAVAAVEIRKMGKHLLK